MNYYDDIKCELINNEINRKVKSYLRRNALFYTFLIIKYKKRN